MCDTLGLHIRLRGITDPEQILPTVRRLFENLIYQGAPFEPLEAQDRDVFDADRSLAFESANLPIYMTHPSVFEDERWAALLWFIRTPPHGAAILLGSGFQSWTRAGVSRVHETLVAVARAAVVTLDVSFAVVEVTTKGLNRLKDTGPDQTPTARSD